MEEKIEEKTRKEKKTDLKNFSIKNRVAFGVEYKIFPTQTGCV